MFRAAGAGKITLPCSKRDVLLKGPRVWAAIVAGLLLCALVLFSALSRPAPVTAVQPKAPGVARMPAIARSAASVTVVTVVGPTQLRSLRELAGSVAFHCPACVLRVYSLRLPEWQSQEVSSWGRTELYDLLDIIQPLQLGSHSLNLVALSLLHTLQSKDTALYIAPSFVLSQPLDRVVSMIRAQGYVFSSPTSHSDGGLITETITHGHFQGFSASSSAGTNLLKALASERACLVGVACAVGDRILLYRKDFKLLQAHELPIVDPAESKSSNVVALFPKAVVNPNSNYERYNDQQLVTFGQEYLGFLVFDLSMLPVHIVDAKLRLHVAWTNAARTKDKSTALLSLVDLSSWPNLSDKWERRPKISPPIHSWDAKKGAFLELDVTSLVIGAANLAWSKSLQMHKPPDDRIAFALSTPTGMWVKYDWNVPDDSLRPQLIFTFRGNELFYRYLMPQPDYLLLAFGGTNQTSDVTSTGSATATRH